jgi:general stress protein 26
MNYYKEAVQKLLGRFGDNDVVYLATVDASGAPNLRPVNACFNVDSFYLVTNRRSEKVREIEVNADVALSLETLRTWGYATNLGHPHDPDNKSLGEPLKALSATYKRRFGAVDDNACVVRITLNNAVYKTDGTEYEIDFARETAQKK